MAGPMRWKQVKADFRSNIRHICFKTDDVKAFHVSPCLQGKKTAGVFLDAEFTLHFEARVVPAGLFAHDASMPTWSDCSVGRHPLLVQRTEPATGTSAEFLQRLDYGG